MVDCLVDCLVDFRQIMSNGHRKCCWPGQLKALKGLTRTKPKSKWHKQFEATVLWGKLMSSKRWQRQWGLCNVVNNENSKCIALHKNPLFPHQPLYSSCDNQVNYGLLGPINNRYFDEQPSLGLEAISIRCVGRKYLVVNTQWVTGFAPVVRTCKVMIHDPWNSYKMPTLCKIVSSFEDNKFHLTSGPC